MALTAGVARTTKGGAESVQFPLTVKNASVVYNGALVSFETTMGEAIPFDGTATDCLAGWHFGDTVTGNSAAPREKCRIRTGPFIFERLTVGGAVANGAADLGKKVYATDDGTYTVNSGGAHVGWITEWYGSGVFDVAVKNVLGRAGSTL